MSKRTIIVAAVVFSMVLSMSFGVTDVQAQEMDVEPFISAVYNFEVEEPGIRGGAEVPIDEEFSFIGDLAYFFMPSDISYMEFRGSAAYDITPRVMPDQEDTAIKPYAGATVQRLSWDNEEDYSTTEVDIHLGGVLTQQVAEDISFRGDVSLSTGTISDFSSMFSIGGGVAFSF